VVIHDLLLDYFGSGGGKFSGLIMPLRRLRCKTKTANFLTRGYYFLVPSESRVFIDRIGYVGLIDPITRPRILGRLAASAELFDKCYAVDFVQGRNPSENLL